MLKRPFINNQIRAEKVRLIDENGKQLGIFNLAEAIQKAKEKNLDLIQVTEKVDPPVCKIMDYGKYLYQQEKKEKESFKKQRGGQLKGIRLSFGISLHDLEIKAHQAKKFLQEKDKIKIEMVLKGREKAHQDLAKEKINQFLEILKKEVSFKIERELKKEAKGFTIIIAKT